MLQLCFYTCYYEKNANKLDLVHQRASVCDICSVPLKVKQQVASNVIKCCFMGTSRQTKQLPVINNKRDRFGENKVKNNFAVSIQYSGLSRCANIFLKTDEFSLIKPGCSVHIVMDEDNTIYGVINNGLKPQKAVTERTISRKEVRLIKLSTP